MKLYIKYMVSLSCKIVVKSELDKLGVRYGTIELGEVELLEKISAEQRDLLKGALLASGLELMDNKKSIIIDKIKNCIIEMVHQNDKLPHIKHSEYLSEKLKLDYTYLANLFSEAKGTTIEHFIIAVKVEKVKEFLLYNELSLTEISYRLNYSSVAHLSAQFRKITGLTPSFFKQIKQNKKHLLSGNKV